MSTCIFGNKATITFSGGAVVLGKVQSIDGWARSVAVADATPLDQADGTYRLKKFSKLMDHEAFAVQMYWDPSVMKTPDIGTVDTITITYPGGEGVLSGAGTVVRALTGQLSVDEISICTYELHFQGGGGGTDPVFT